MGNRMSGRERMERMRAEADAAAKEKEAAKAARDAAPKSPRKSSSKKAAPPPGRVRIVWMVCDATGKDVKQFPYPQEKEARAEAEQLTASTGKTHFVKQADVPA